MIRITAVVGVALLAAGCGLLPPASPAAMGESQLAVQSRRWTDSGPRDYRAVVRYTCECELSGEVTVDVADGSVVAVSLDGRPLPLEVSFAYPLTVDQMFAHGALALANGGTVRGTFDPVTGAPRTLQLDSVPQMVNDELGIEVVSITPRG